MTTILPGFVLGPPLSNDLDGASAQIIKKIMNDNIYGLPEFLSIADVRDIAFLLVKSLKQEASDGKRIIATSPNSIHISLISKILIDNGFNIAGHSKTNKILDKGGYSSDISKTINIFNWKPNPLEKTILDMVKTIKLFEKKY